MESEVGHIVPKQLVRLKYPAATSRNCSFRALRDADSPLYAELLTSTDWKSTELRLSVPTSRRTVPKSACSTMSSWTSWRAKRSLRTACRLADATSGSFITVKVRRKMHVLCCPEPLDRSQHTLLHHQITLRSCASMSRQTVHCLLP
jgi:hypothetical protein